APLGLGIGLDDLAGRRAARPKPVAEQAPVDVVVGIELQRTPVQRDRGLVVAGPGAQRAEVGQHVGGGADRDGAFEGAGRLVCVTAQHVQEAVGVPVAGVVGGQLQGLAVVGDCFVQVPVAIGLKAHLGTYAGIPGG